MQIVRYWMLLSNISWKRFLSFHNNCNLTFSLKITPGLTGHNQIPWGPLVACRPEVRPYPPKIACALINLKCDVWVQKGTIFRKLHMNSLQAFSQRGVRASFGHPVADFFFYTQISIFVCVYDAMGWKGIGHPIHPTCVFLDTQFWNPG